MSLIDPPDGGVGRAYGILSEDEESKAKRAFVELLEPKRTRGAYFPEYGKDKNLGRVLHLAVAARCTALALLSS
jgi:hypothetical protein